MTLKGWTWSLNWNTLNCWFQFQTVDDDSKPKSTIHHERQWRWKEMNDDDDGDEDEDNNEITVKMIFIISKVK